MTRYTRTVRSLAAALVGLYAVAALGTTEAVTSAESACSGWPTCGGGVVPQTGPALVAWGHRAAVAVVGVLLLYAGVNAVRERTPTRALAALAVTVAGYAVEIDIGRRAAAGTAVAGPHLAVALVVLAGVVAALVWTLDDVRTARPDTEPHGAANATTDGAHDWTASSVTPERAIGTSDEPGRTEYTDPSGEPGRTECIDPSGEPEWTGFDAAVRRWQAVAAAYARLTKPRLMWLLSLVAVAGLVLGARGVPSPATATATLAGGALSIGSSGVFNNVLERDRDAQMERTSDRPVVTHAVSARRATVFGVVLLIAALAVFLAFVNPVAAVLDLAAVAFYVIGYTLVLKPNTSWNVTVGGAVGAFPALIGYAAVTGGVGLPAFLLGLVVFAWTPAHFYNLALAYEDDYAAGGYPMLPVVKGRAKTRRHALGYLGATLAATLTFAAATGTTLAFVAITAAVAGVFLTAVVTTFRVDTDRTALRAFHASNAYLGAFLAAVVLTGVF